MTVDQEPVKAGIDPMYKFVDRDSEDNLVRVSLGVDKENDK